MTRLALAIAALMGSSAWAADTQMWNEVGVGYRASKTIGAGLGGQLRFDHDLARLGAQMIDSEVQWRAVKWLRLGLGYRQGSEKNKKDVDRSIRRVHVESRAQLRLGDFALRYRLRLQDKTEEKKNGEEQTLSLRHLLGANLKVSKAIRAGAGFELYTRFDGAVPSFLHKLRVTGSLRYKLSSRHSIKSFVRAQIPIRDAEDPIEQIIGLGYELSVKR